ncbi:hypothetical protein F-LCD7_0234 [Faustovirus]|nr:hypothetical protein F-LCD7_0234 [Faustovirus]
MESLREKPYTELNVSDIDFAKLGNLYTNYYRKNDFVSLSIRKANGEKIEDELPYYEVFTPCIGYKYDGKYLYICRPTKNYTTIYDSRGIPVYYYSKTAYNNAVYEIEQIDLYIILSKLMLSDKKYTQYFLHMVLKKATDVEIISCLASISGIRISHDNYASLLNFDHLPDYMKPDIEFVSSCGSKLKAHKFIIIKCSKMLYDAISDTEDTYIKLPFTSKIIKGFIQGLYRQEFTINTDWSFDEICEYIHIFDYTMVIDKPHILKSYLHKLE